MKTQNNIRTCLRHSWNSVEALKMIYGARAVKVAQKAIRQQDLKALVMPKPKQWKYGINDIDSMVLEANLAAAQAKCNKMSIQGTV